MLRAALQSMLYSAGTIGCLAGCYFISRIPGDAPLWIIPQAVLAFFAFAFGRGAVVASGCALDLWRSYYRPRRYPVA
jgi:hypothetical protein